MTNDRISVKSGHGVGKTMVAGLSVIWFLCCYTPSLVISTAPTERQVKELLWREIRARKTRSLIPLPGKPLIMKWDISANNYALGLSTDDVMQLTGFHSPYLMIIVDEANGFPEHLFDGLEGILSGGGKAILFMIGNPIDPIGTFFKSFDSPEYRRITISCLNHPNVLTGENLIPGAVTKKWVEKKSRDWGTDSSLWYSRVIGEFPRIGENNVINLVWVEQAEMLIQKDNPKEQIFMGVDVADAGGDPWVWYIGTRRKRMYIEQKKNIEIMGGVGHTIILMKRFGIKDENITVDGIGVGAGVVSRFRELGYKINRFIGSESAVDDGSFKDKVTEAWWLLRILFKPDNDEYLPFSLSGRAEDLKSDLCTRKYSEESTGKLKLEEKKVYRKRMKRSPNFADAMAMCYHRLLSRSRTVGMMVLPSVY